MGYPNRSEKTDRWGNPPMSQTLSQLMSSSMGSNPGIDPVAVQVRGGGWPYAEGPQIIGKNQTPFTADNPYQSYAGLPLNPALGAIDSNVREPVSLTVTGGNHAYNNPAWGAGSILNPAWGTNPSLYAQVGADPGMGGLNGNMQMAPGIPGQLPPSDGSSPLPKWQGGSLPQIPSTPQYGQAGFMHNGSSNEPAAYSSGGYLFDRNGRQIGRDPNGVISQTYGGTAEAKAKADARERLTAGTMPQQNALESMGLEQWLQRHPEVNPASMRPKGSGGGGSNSMSGGNFGARAMKGK